MLFTRGFSHVRVILPSKDGNVADEFCSVVAQDIAEEIVWCASRPAHVNIAQLCKVTVPKMCIELTSFFFSRHACQPGHAYSCSPKFLKS